MAYNSSRCDAAWCSHRELERDGLCDKVLVQGLLPQVLAEPALPEPAEGGGHVRLVVRVDKARACVDLLRHVQRLVDIAREHARRQPELRGVGAAHHQVHIAVEAGDDHDGPKRLLARDEHVVLYLREDGRLEEQAGPVGLLATQHEARTLLHALLAVLHQLLQVCAVVLWAMCSAPVKRVAHRHLPHLVHHHGNKLVMDAVLYKHTPRRDAILALVEKHATDRLLHRAFQVGVCKDDQRALAPELQGHLFHVAGARRHDVLPNLCGAGEAQLAHERVVGNGLSAHRPRAGQDVHHAGRDAGLHGQLRKLQRRQRRHLCGLHDARVARGQARGHLPRKHHQGVVPGCDEAHHANRLLFSDGEVVVWACVVDGDGAALDLVAPARKVAPRVDGHADMRLKGQRVHRARVERLQCGQLLPVRLHEVCQAVQQAAPFARVHAAPWPALKRHLGRQHRAVDVLRGGALHLADEALVRRVDAAQPAQPARCIAKAPVDEQLVRKAQRHAVSLHGHRIVLHDFLLGGAAAAAAHALDCELRKLVKRGGHEEVVAFEVHLQSVLRLLHQPHHVHATATRREEVRVVLHGAHQDSLPDLAHRLHLLLLPCRVVQPWLHLLCRTELAAGYDLAAHLHSLYIHEVPVRPREQHAVQVHQRGVGAPLHLQSAQDGRLQRVPYLGAKARHLLPADHGPRTRHGVHPSDPVVQRPRVLAKVDA
mmetsp:Transcript_39544/g.99690  ORF Transcript_39544/g.99690 Transcript_39544/m.99690 type:complete len:710 (-) Transcript_39544:804-2933(-)